MAWTRLAGLVGAFVGILEETGEMMETLTRDEIAWEKVENGFGKSPSSARGLGCRSGPGSRTGSVSRPLATV